MGDRDRPKTANFPSHDEEFEKCRDFLQNYTEGVNNLPYLVQLVCIDFAMVPPMLCHVLSHYSHSNAPFISLLLPFLPTQS
jgi:hypothetical protein